MQQTNGRRALMKIAAGLVLALACGPGSAQDTPVTLRLSHWSPPQHPMSQIAVPEWVSAIEKDSGGSIKIQVFPSQQLGKAIDHYDMARDGVADITWVNAGLQPSQALEMPWLYSDPAGATLAFDEWYRPLAEKEMKDVKVC
ncbi:MAG: C4-dicarboxylate ABC transporter, partial [Xanthobacteraceae bacterium]